MGLRQAERIEELEATIKQIIAHAEERRYDPFGEPDPLMRNIVDLCTDALADYGPGEDVAGV